MAYLAKFELLWSSGVYPIICFFISAFASAFCFCFIYVDRAMLANVREVGLLAAVLSVQFQLAVYLSLAIAVPMGVDLITDTVNILRQYHNKFFHCFVRVCLLVSLTLPSILLAIPSVFQGQEDSGYLAVDSVKRISATGCMLAFICYQSSLNFRDIELKAHSSGGRIRSFWRGRLTITLYATYVAAELLWLYGYRYHHTMITTYCLKVAATTLLSLGYLQLLHLVYFCENFDLGQICTSCCRSAFSKKIKVSQSASCRDLAEDVTSLDPSHIDLYDSKSNTCIRIYFAVLIMQPIGSFLISSFYGSMDFLSPTPDSLSANLYFQMALTILVSLQLFPL